MCIRDSNCSVSPLLAEQTLVRMLRIPFSSSLLQTDYVLKNVSSDNEITYQVKKSHHYVMFPVVPMDEKVLFVNGK